jgi:hypothetical protein
MAEPPLPSLVLEAAMLNWLRKLMRHKRKPMQTYWWVASSGNHEELPPLADDPLFVTRHSRYNISEMKVPKEIG